MIRFDSTSSTESHTYEANTQILMRVLACTLSHRECERVS
uniref:Uncharacterized protein n=1 Tax=Anguilla anguilla TaxID=7936 RepID=A0A0E9PJR8_ANGAN